MLKNIPIPRLFGTLVLALLLFLGGCGNNDTENTTKQKPLSLQIRAEGTIIQKTNDFLLKSFFLVDNDNAILYELKSDAEDLSQYIDEQVLIYGFQESEKNITPPILEVYKLALYSVPEKKEKTPFTWNENGLSGILPEGWTIKKQQNDDTTKILIENESQKEIINISNNTIDVPTRNQLIKDGVEITIYSKRAIRTTRGKNTDIQMIESPYLLFSFFGEKNEKFLFYEMISSLSFGTPSSQDDNIQILNTKEEKESEDIEQEQTSTTLPPVEAYNTHHQQIQEKITTDITTLSPESKIQDLTTTNTTITQYIFDESNLVSVEYRIDDKKYRSVFSYQLDVNDVIVNLEAHYHEGINTSWELKEGNPQITQGNQTVFTPDTSKLLYIPEDFALYVSTHFNFSIAYPKSMYFSAEGKTENQQAAVYFSSVPANAENAFIIVKILDGSQEKERELESENIIEIPRNDSSYFQISTVDPSMYETIKSMASTISSAL